MYNMREIREQFGVTVKNWLFGFYGISTFIGYLMPNSVMIKNWTSVESRRRIDCAGCDAIFPVFYGQTGTRIKNYGENCWKGRKEESCMQSIL